MNEVRELTQEEAEDVIGVFWQLLVECEAKADGKRGDPILRSKVEGGYRLLNRLGFTKSKPAWIVREESKNDRVLGARLPSKSARGAVRLYCLSVSAADNIKDNLNVV